MVVLSGGDNIGTIGFIGAGKCGMSLAYYFRSKGFRISGFLSRNNNTEDFDFLSCEELVSKSDIIFVTVTDTNIPYIWEEIRHMNLDNKIICHCSGSVSSRIFKGADYNMVCSVHPMLAFNSKHTSLNSISNAFFTLEGGNRAVDKLSEILLFCGNKFKTITSENKTKYHASCCFASNFVVSVCYRAVKLLFECGFSEEEAQMALAPLMSCNMEHIIEYGTKKAITGPAIRGDMSTIDNHMKVLDKKTQKLYRCLTEVIFEMKETMKEEENEKYNGYI